MVTFLSAAKNTQHKGDPQQSTPVRRSSFQLRALRKHSETIQTQMLHCPTAYTTASEVSFRLLRRFSRNTDRTTSKSRWTSLNLSFQIPAKHRQDQRGHPRLELARLSACQPWQTTPPPFRMERRTCVLHHTYTIPASQRQAAFSRDTPFLDIMRSYRGVKFVRNNPNFLGMERLECLFVRMRESYLFRACFTLPLGALQAA